MAGMATTLPSPSAAPLDSVWRAPLAPAALAYTAGVVFDHYAAVPFVVSLLLTVGGVLGWLVARLKGRVRLPLVFLALAVAAFGAAFHHYRRDVLPADDVGNLAPAEPRPVEMRGILDEEPLHTPPQPDPLRSIEAGVSSTTVLRATALRRGDDWECISGRVHLMISGSALDLHAGDEVEAVGRLSLIHGPANPGEADAAAAWRDKGVRAQLVTAKTADGVARLERGWPASFAGCTAMVRGWGRRALADALPAETAGTAAALVLGEGSAMTQAEWDKFIRTGVVHALAISGQHLMILAVVLWWALRRLGVRQRYGAVAVGAFLLAYALMTGGRPPAMRATIAVCAACGGLALRHRTLPANLFALSWLAVALADPADIFTPGCQLSFLSVAVLQWGARPLLQREPDALQQLIDEARPAWLRWVRWLGGVVLKSYLLTLIVWTAIAPLAAAHYHLLSPIGVLLGPPLVLLTAVALVAGFLLLAAAALCPPLTLVFAPVVYGSLGACEFLVNLCDGWPFARFYVGDVPQWWTWVFYLSLLALLTQGPLRRRWRWGAAAGLGWLCVGLLCGAARFPEDELRCTFLAVGHGGCTVIETADGRTLLYDAGALGGPDVTRRQIAPFLWHRGIRRIDEVFLSHADLDHFNGLPELLDRFAVGQVTCTPTFANKNTSGVQVTLDALRSRGIPIRIVHDGADLRAGDVHLEVLHPPAQGPDGNENTRSLVLEVHHAGHTILLTGDLEGLGLERVLGLPPRRLDVMMAPHHGSKAANVPELADWAQPRVAISSQGPPRGPGGVPEPYTAKGARFLSTWADGAITVRSHSTGMVVETFVTGQRFVLRTEAGEE
jgi:competence protein ComEC